MNDLLFYSGKPRWQGVTSSRANSFKRPRNGIPQNLHFYLFYYILLHFFTFFYILSDAMPSPIGCPPGVEHLGHGSYCAVDILIGSLPVADAHPHRSLAVPGRPTEKRLPITNHCRDHSISPLGMVLI